jgi:hypothetical protein
MAPQPQKSTWRDGKTKMVNRAHSTNVFKRGSIYLNSYFNAVMHVIKEKKNQ